MEACQKLAEELGYSVAQEHIFVDDGYSGATMSRPHLEALREVADESIVQAVICHDPDRLSRKLAHLLLLVEEWERRSVRVHFVLQPMDSSPESMMFFQLKGIFAEYERAKFMERSARGKRKRLQEGKVHISARPTYGYVYHAKNSDPNDPMVGTYSIESSHAEIVKQIFQWLLEEDLSTGEIARRLVGRGIPSPSGSTRWHRHTVATILKNYTYAGMMHHNKRVAVPCQKGEGKFSYKLRPREEWIIVPVPEFIPKEWVDSAVEKLEQHKHRCTRNPRHPYLLSGMGILWCACGTAMTGRARLRKNGSYYRWYDCNNKYPSYWPHDRCKVRDLNAQIADGWVWTEVSNLLLNPGLMISELRRRYEGRGEQLNRLQRDIDALEERLHKIDEEREDLAYMGRKRFFGPRTLEIVASEAKKLEMEEKTLLQEKRHLEGQLRTLTIREEDIIHINKVCERLHENLHNLRFEDMRKVVSTLVDRILWDGETLHLRLIIPAEEVAMLSAPHSP